MRARFLVPIMFWVYLDSALVLADEAAENPATASAQSWLAQIDSGNYPKSWKEASAYF